MAKLTAHLALISFMAACVGATANADVRGYAKPITDPKEQFYAQSLLRKALVDVGLPAHLRGCRLFEQVSMGDRNSESAYAAACRVGVGARAPREFVVCTSDLTGGLTLHGGSFVNSAEWMEGFIRANCF